MFILLAMIINFIKVMSVSFIQEVARLLMENGANIDSKNILKNTPLNSGIEGLQRKICHVGCFYLYVSLQFVYLNC